MPCTDGGPTLDQILRERLDRVTRLLCGVLERIDERSRAKFMRENHDLATWWEEHQRVDAERRRKESDCAHEKRVRDEALAKLTPDERKALGLLR